MIRITLSLLLLVFLSQVMVAQSEPQDEHDSSKWESQIQAFENSDDWNMPPQHAILFVGSSSIRRWDLEESFPKLVTINRGFGGSQLADAVKFIDRIVLKHKPSAVVMYAGDNDLNSGKSPERVFADYAEFVAILQKHLPDTPLHYVAIKPSIKRWSLIDKIRRTNKLISSYCELNDKLFFVDVDSPMLNPDGSLRKSLFVKDGLHLNKSGYQLWTKTLQTSLNKDGATRFASSSFDRNKRRVIVLTDISNEPDDEQSVVRFLCYANQFDVEGLIATTSCWLRDRVVPQKIIDRIEAYRKVRPNLLKHADGWPTAEHLLSVVNFGSTQFGMEGVGKGHDSNGSKEIINVVDRPDPRPVYVSIWGGANCLAQSLWQVKETRTEEELNRFVSKLRVYAISDQDDSGPWIRKTFPKLFFVVSPGFEENDGHAYHHATWVGISGDNFHGRFSGADFSIVDNAWLDQNVRQNHGPLGALYPQTQYLMEGDSPSFLWLVNNGLNDPDHPHFGGWGGRYELYAPPQQSWHYQPVSRPIWTDAFDTVTGLDGKKHRTNQSTIWRWREAIQNDFAARMDWTTADEFGQANHAPAIIIDDDDSKRIFKRGVESGDTVQMTCLAKDPDGDAVELRWWQYAEAGTYPGSIDIKTADNKSFWFVAPKVRSPKTIHVLVQARDQGTPNLYSYRRLVFTVVPGSERTAPDKRPRVYVTTDISVGEDGPDDRQSLCHLLYYADELDIRGIVPEKFEGTGRQACSLAIDQYEADYNRPWTKFRQYGFPTPTQIRTLIKTNKDQALDHFIAEAKRDDKRPLYVLAWGNLEFLGEAIRKDPKIVNKIRLLSVATNYLAKSDKGDGEKANFNARGRDYIYGGYPELWWIENDWTYNGMFQGQGPVAIKDSLAQLGGNLGQHITEVIDEFDWSNYFSAGDTPTVLYLLDPNHNPNDPKGQSWAGRFERPFPKVRPDYWTGINGDIGWDYNRPATTWDNADAVFKARIQTMLKTRPEMYSSLLAKVKDLYGHGFEYERAADLKKQGDKTQLSH